MTVMDGLPGVARSCGSRCLALSRGKKRGAECRSVGYGPETYSKFPGNCKSSEESGIFLDTRELDEVLIGFQAVRIRQTTMIQGVTTRVESPPFVIPAKAGIQSTTPAHWMPACTGMTMLFRRHRASWEILR